MSRERELLKQALDALEELDHLNGWPSNLSEEIREELAKPELSPPQQKPLSDEEIMNMFDDVARDSSIDPKNRVLIFARSIEKAHGIGK